MCWLLMASKTSPRERRRRRARAGERPTPTASRRMACRGCPPMPIKPKPGKVDGFATPDVSCPAKDRIRPRRCAFRLCLSRDRSGLRKPLLERHCRRPASSAWQSATPIMLVLPGITLKLLLSWVIWRWASAIRRRVLHHGAVAARFTAPIRLLLHVLA